MTTATASLRLPAPEVPAWLAPHLEGFTRYRIRTSDGLALHVMERGEGLPVVCVHGNPTWGFLWRKVAAALASAEGLRIILPDLAGLGLSDAPPSAKDHTIEGHARWLREVLDALGLDRLILCVQDWGGAIGVLAAEGRIAGLVALNTALSEPKPGFRPTLFHRVAHSVLGPFLFDTLGLTQRSMRLAQGDPSSIRGVVARAYRWPLRGRRRVAPLALARMVPDGLDHPSMGPLRRCREIVQAFDGPAAIVWGDRDPVLGRLRSWIQTLLPQAPVTRTSAGHFLQEEVPGEIAAAIRRVVAAVRSDPTAGAREVTR